MRNTISIVALGILLNGCLASTYRVPQDELIRLANTPPEARGQRVRVVQDIGGGHHPENPRPAGHYFPHLVLVSPPPVVIVPRPGLPVGRLNVGGGRGGGGGGGGGGNAEAVLLILAAVGTTLALVATEGSRFDGWAQVDPNTPVLLRGEGGQTVVPLSLIDPQVAAWARDGFIDRETTVFQETEGAPLNHVGGTFALHMGAAGGLLQSSELSTGFTARPEVGGFFLQEVGIKVAYEATFSSRPSGSTSQQSLLGMLQIMPIPWLGFFGEAGFTALDLGRAGYYAGTKVGGGVIVEVPLNARLALELRGAAHYNDFGPTLHPVTAAGTLGIAIY